MILGGSIVAAAAGAWGQPRLGNKESERRGLLQRHAKEIVVERGKEDGEQGEGKPN